MDLVTNGIESWVRDGGKSMAQFIIAIFDGKPRTWLDILEKTRIKSWWGLHDPNRNVDGEQDNVYDPVFDPIEILEATAQSIEVKNMSAACGQTAGGTLQLTATSDGADRVDFLVDGQQVGTDSQAPFSYSWDSTAASDGNVTITVRATDAGGRTATDDCTVTVSNGGGGDLFFDDMESGAGGWTATGLWHRAQSGSCASPAYASPVSAWYFGQDSTCSFDTNAAVKGSLTSQTINGVTAASRLSFKFFREVESHTSGGYDATRVEVVEAGSSDWNTVWSRSCEDASAKAWSSAGPIDLSVWAGKSIQLRFVFDSKDSYANDFIGWIIDDVRVTQ